MTNQLIPYSEVEQFGKAMVASRFFKDVTQVSQAIVKIQAGAEIGLPPFASMTGVHIISGKPVLGANLIATLIANDSRYSYRVTEHTDEVCTVVFFEGGEKVGESSFSTADAKKAGINNQNWQKYPRNMLFARAISNGAKWYTPGIFGGMPVYTPDEFGLQVDEEGDVVEGSYESQPAIQPTSSEVNQPMKPTLAMMKKLHAIGTQKFGPEWDDARHELISKLTDGRTKSSKDLAYDEVVKLAEMAKGFDDYVEPLFEKEGPDEGDALSIY